MIRLGLIASALMLSLTGCAVLNIDVDVYKGPLANHKDVQLQQLAQFAIGAQPILVKLCVEEEQDATGGNPQSCATPTIGGAKSNIARQVQEILALYDDLLPHDILAKIDLLNKQLAIYEGAYNLAFPDPTDATNKKLWDNLQKKMWPEFTSDHPAVAKAGNQKIAVEAELHYLKTAYDKFLTGEQFKQNDPHHGTRDQDLLLCAQAKLYPLFPEKAVREQLLGTFDPHAPTTTGLEQPYHVTKQGDKDYTQKCSIDLPYEKRFENRKKLDPTSATAEFEGLLRNDAELIVKHADLLFPSTQIEEKNQFIEGVKAAANNFLLTRQYANQLLLTSLELISLMHNPNPLLQKPTKEHLLDATANLAAELIRPRYLWYALENTAPSDSEKATIKSLRDYIQDSLKEAYGELHSPTHELKNRFSYLLISRLKADSSTAPAILLAHHALIKNFTPPDEARLTAIKFTLEDKFKNLRQEYDEDNKKVGDKNGAHWRYGISRGEPPPKLIDLHNQLTNISQVPGLLHKGRALEGIASLSKSYGEKINSSPPHTRLTMEVRLLEQQLHNTLVHFSQKVLIVGNFDVLTELPVSESIVRTIYNVLKTIVWNGNTKEQRSNRYQSILQAVGNSILIQADELRARREHEDRLAARAGEELLALEAALTKSAPQVMTDLIRGLEADLADIPKKTQSIEDSIKQANSDKVLQEQILEQKSVTVTSESTTLNGLKGKGISLKEISSAEQALKNESDSLKSDLTITPSTPLNIPADIKNFTDALNQRLTAIDQKSDRWSKLKVLHAYLTNSDNQVATRMGTYTNTDSFLKEISTAIQKHKSEFLDTPQTLDQKITQQTLLVQTSAKEKADAQRELTTITNKIATLTTEKMQLENDRPIKALALKNVLVHGSDIMTRTASLPNSGTQALILLIDMIGKERFDSAGTRTNNADDLDKVMLLLAEKIPQSDPALAKRLAGVGKRCKDHFDNTPSCKSSQEILDDVIGILRHEYIQEVRTSGEGKGQTEKIQSALKAAWDLRSSMVYIRPSGSYLRSSFPSTSLQDDPVLATDNLLAEKALLHMPFDMPLRLICQLALPKSAESICKDEDRGKLRAQTALDKQFWQNINRVRLTGGGWTNYVAAKDDIGNWYVKEVDTDPKDIIRAAKKLALFGLGTAGTTALASAVTQKTTDGESTPTDQPMAPLQQVYAKYRAAYESANSEAVSQLKKILGSDGIRKTIQLSWEGNPLLRDRLGDLNTALSHAAGQLNDAKDALVNAKDDTEQPLHVVTALKSIVRFHNDLQSAIHTMDIAAKEKEAVAMAKRDFEKVDPSQQDEKKKAAEKVGADEAALKTKQDAAASASKAVRDTCFETLARQLKNSQVANKAYEQSLMFIGEVRAGAPKK